MIHKLKIFVLALASVFVIAAIASGSAVAVTPFHCETSSCRVTATSEGNHVLTTPAGTVTCTHISGEAIISATVEAITLENLKTTGCKTKTIFGEIEVSFNYGGCDIRLTPQPIIDTNCSFGEIAIEGPGCKITIPGGQNLSGVTYTNIGIGTTLEITADISKAGVKSTATGAFCSSTGTSTTGTYKGSLRLTGENASNTHLSLKYL